jgi:hypothetical protein
LGKGGLSSEIGFFYQLADDMTQQHMPLLDTGGIPGRYIDQVVAQLF